MNMVIPNEGKRWWLREAAVLHQPGIETWQLKLFKNDYTPVDETTIIDFTEADFLGYANVVILRAEMSDPIIVSNVAETTRGTAPQFTSTDPVPQTVYGWYLTMPVTPAVLAAQRFDSPRVMSLGTTLAIDPFKLKLKTFSG